MQLRENIEMGEGNFYRIIRWRGESPYVEIVGERGSSRRIPAHGARWHYHKAIELTFLSTGRSACFLSDKFLEFGAGDLFILGANIPHYWHHPRVSSGLSIQWELPESHGAWECNELKPLRIIAERATHGLCLSGEPVDHAMVKLQRMTRTHGLERFGLFLELMHEVMYANQETTLASVQPLKFDGTNPHEEAVHRAISYIHASYREAIGLPEVLSVSGMSRTNFTRHFIMKTGCCFTTFLNRVRLQAVCRELVSSTTPISSVALEHGFTQLAFFNRLFKREFGVTPTAYRAAGKDVRVAG